MPTLEITTKLGCSLACTFCPQKRLVKNYRSGSDRMLQLDNFKAVIDKIPDYVRVDFSGMSEPWLNPSATEMVIYAYERKRSVAVYTTLEGLPVTEAKIMLERFHHNIRSESPWVVHLPDNENNMPGWKRSDDYLATLEYIIEFKRRFPSVKIDFMTMSQEGKVHESIFEIFKDRLGSFVGISRADNLDREKVPNGSVVPKINHDLPVMCSSSPFLDHNGMLPNGDVTLCCMDYSIGSVIGNIFDQEYFELFSSPVMQEIRTKSMKYGKDKTLICKQCEVATCLDLKGAGWNLRSDTGWAEAPGSFRNGQMEISDRHKTEMEIFKAENQVLLEELTSLRSNVIALEESRENLRSATGRRFSPSNLLARARKISRL